MRNLCSGLSFNLSQEFIHEFLLVMEAGLFGAFECISEIKQPMFGGHSEEAERSRNPKSFASGDADTFAIVH